MHIGYIYNEEILNDDAKNIFESTKYGDKILLDLLKEKFTLPIKITNKYHSGAYAIFIRWNIETPKNNNINNDERCRCIIL